MTTEFRHVPSVYDHLCYKGSIQTATSLSGPYCPRAVSFGAVALNACLGILDAAEITHFLGVPIERGQVTNWRCPMALCWRNPNADSQERLEFPTWSWARWSGRKTFYTGPPAPDLKIEIHLDNGEWVEIMRAGILKGNIGDVSSIKDLRLTGTTISPRFTSQRGRLLAVFETNRREQLMDSEKISCEDLRDAVLMICSDMRMESMDGYSKSFTICGLALVVKPGGDSFVREGVAEDFVCSSEVVGTLEQGSFTLLNAEWRTIHLV
jgi:hypothetical protein